MPKSAITSMAASAAVAISSTPYSLGVNVRANTGNVITPTICSAAALTP
jgi:hypothetical protein